MSCDQPVTLAIKVLRHKLLYLDPRKRVTERLGDATLSEPNAKL
jgi:hypothetical protein